MIFVDDEDVVVRHVCFQLDPNNAEEVMLKPAPEVDGVSMTCDDGSVSFTVVFPRQPEYAAMLRRLADLLDDYDEMVRRVSLGLHHRR